jgi:hypothetical protein
MSGIPEEVAKRLVREADQWKGSGGTGRFPQLLRRDIPKHDPFDAPG